MEGNLEGGPGQAKADQLDRGQGLDALTIVDHFVRSQALFVVVQDGSERFANLRDNCVTCRLQLGEVVCLLD